MNTTSYYELVYSKIKFHIPPKRKLIFICLKEKPRSMPLRGFFLKKNKQLKLGNYHLIIALAQVNPLPNAAKTTVSPDFIFPCSQASVSAIGIEAAVVLPYF